MLNNGKETTVIYFQDIIDLEIKFKLIFKNAKKYTNN